jgi:predicted small lipoprotein YifL
MEVASVMKTLIVSGLMAVIAASTAACGRMADLEAPPAKQTERSQRSGQGPAPTDPATVYRRPMEQPIDGAGSNPYSGSGAYPDPR